MISSILVFISLNLIMDLYLYIYDPDWRGIIQDKEIKKSPRLFIVGSSSVYSLDSSYISEALVENKLDYDVYNLADMSDVPSHRLKSIEHLISLKPDVVVYGIGFVDIVPSNSKKNITTIEEIIRKNPKEIFGEIFPNYFGKELIPKLPTSPKDKTILTLKYLVRGPEHIHNPFINFLKTDIVTKQVLESIFKDEEFNTIEKFSDNNEIVALKNIIEKLQENNIKVIIFSVPYSDTVLKKIPVEKQEYFKKYLTQTANEFGINVEHLHDKYADLPIWKDPVHVAINQNVTVYSEDLVQIILKELT